MKDRKMSATKQWPTVETVLMTDERLVDFPERRKLWKSSYLNGDGNVCVRPDFRNGQTRTMRLRRDMIAQWQPCIAWSKLH
jgi:hypothetical protein